MSISPTDSISALPGVGPVVEEKLNRAGIFTVLDLLTRVPLRYEDYTAVHTTQSAKLEEHDAGVTIVGNVRRIGMFRTKTGRQMITATIEDQEGTIQSVWFGNSWLISQLKPGTTWRFSGKISTRGRYPQLMQARYEAIDLNELDPGELEGMKGRIIPIYPQTSEVTTTLLRRLITTALDRVQEIPDPVSEEVRERFHLQPLAEVIREMHQPTKPISQALELQFATRDLLQLLEKSEENRRARLSQKPYKTLTLTTQDRKQFEKNLPFQPSPSQLQAMFDVAIDLMQTYPARRLIQGEVGSGKTLIAAFIAYVALKNNTDAVLLTPTQILAKQHHESLRPIFEKLSIRTQLVVGTSNATQSSTKTDQPTFYIGTHALLKDRFTPSIVVIDEEHRFGVEQREFFSHHPHQFSLTATPIPRTVAQTVLSNLEVSKLDRLPGREPKIETIHMKESKREQVYAEIHQQLTHDPNAQLLVVCPFVEQSEHDAFSQIKSAEQEFMRIRARFPEFETRLIHGRTPVNQRSATLEEMASGDARIMVSTPVIEVGVDLPLASLMIIENPERFGLAQLHQLRGRIGRRGQQSRCYLVGSTGSTEAEERLGVFCSTLDGTILAEHDLRTRGGGEIFGTAQSGYSKTLQYVVEGKLDHVLDKL